MLNEFCCALKIENKKLGVFFPEEILTLLNKMISFTGKIWRTLGQSVSVEITYKKQFSHR